MLRPCANTKAAFCKNGKQILQSYRLDKHVIMVENVSSYI